MHSKDNISKAMNVDIVDYCEQNDIALFSDTERYYRMVDHDSLVIDRKKNSFYWNSRQIGGNPINFVREIEGVGFKQAMAKLLEQEYELSDQVKFVHEPYEYSPEKEANNFGKARDYLIKERKIDPGIVDDLHDKGLLKQDKRNNVLFLWKNHENVMGCSEQGTSKNDRYKRGSWKSIQENSTENYGFSVQYGNPEKLKFFESSIDLLSYATLNKDKIDNSMLVSMEGLKPSIVTNYLVKATQELGRPPKSIDLCVDNDKAGINFIKKMDIGITYKDGTTIDVIAEIPPKPFKAQKWDWSDQCKSVKSKEDQRNLAKKTYNLGVERGL